MEIILLNFILKYSMMLGVQYDAKAMSLLNEYIFWKITSFSCAKKHAITITIQFKCKSIFFCSFIHIDFEANSDLMYIQNIWFYLSLQVLIRSWLTNTSYQKPFKILGYIAASQLCLGLIVAFVSMKMNNSLSNVINERKRYKLFFNFL